MIVTNKITIDQKQIIDSIRQKANHYSESHSFNSLFLWQNDMGLSICINGDAFIVKCNSRKDNCYYFPCGKESTVKSFIDELIGEKVPFKFIYAREEDIEFINKNYDGVFEMKSSDGDSEYIYNRDSYLKLEGDGYRRIRKDLKKLKSNHEIRTEVWTKENQNDMIEVLKKWHSNHPGEDGLIDFGTSKLLIENKEKLGIEGIITYIDGLPLAMAAGFPLSYNSYDIAFSKSAVKMNGLQDYTRLSLAKIIPSDYSLLNGEDDLGIPGLRLIKELMRPIGKIKMFEVIRK